MSLWIYTHWGGYDLAETVRDAIALARDRWNDENYCSRIITMHVMQQNSNGLTGCGIANHSMDSEYNDIFIDVPNQKLTIGNNEWTFKEFIDISDLELVLKEIGERQ